MTEPISFTEALRQITRKGSGELYLAEQARQLDEASKAPRGQVDVVFPSSLIAGNVFSSVGGYLEKEAREMGEESPVLEWAHYGRKVRVPEFHLPEFLGVFRKFNEERDWGLEEPTVVAATGPLPASVRY